MAKIDANPLTRGLENKKPVHAIITNSTYDGLCYHATEVEDLLGKSVDSIHFDEAWYGYARFNPLYCERFAMRDGDRNPKGPTVFATQSTHKLLAALSQASMVHVRNGRVPIEHSRFNEGFMMHSSTSPLYTIMASLDVSSKMMDGSGRACTRRPNRLRRRSGSGCNGKDIPRGLRDRETERLVVRDVAAGRRSPILRRRRNVAFADAND